MDVSIYCYGSGELVRQILNAVAALMKPGSGFIGYLSIAFLLAAMVSSIQYIHTKKISVLFYTVIRYSVISSVLLAPVFNVQIIDEIKPGKALSVSHVPLGLALPASISSTFFHSLTKGVETAFHMPDDLNYTKTGFLFASSLVQKSTSFIAVNANDRENLKRYVEQCVYYDIHHGKYGVNDLLNSQDIWGLVSAKASPLRSFLMDSNIVTCREGTVLFSNRWNDILGESGVKYAKVIFPGLKAEANNRLKETMYSHLGTSYQHLTDLSRSGSSIMQQMIMVNAVRDGALNNSVLGSLSYSKTKGDSQKFMGSVNTGMLAAQWLPILKDVIECLLYSVFVLVVIYAIFSDGYKVLVNYVISIAYVGSWPVVFAFLNFGATYAIRLTSTGHTLSMVDLSYLDSTNYYLSSLFGYITLTVPYLAWQLINLGKQGLGSALTQLSQLVGGATQSIAMGTAQEVSSGNFNFGNTSFGNHSLMNVSGFKHDTNLGIASGSMSVAGFGGTVFTQNADGSHLVNQSNSLSNLNTQVHLGNSIRASAGRQADESESAARSDAFSYAKTMGQTLNQMHDYSSHMSQMQSSGDTFGISDSSSYSKSLQSLSQEIHRFALANNVSDDVAQKHLTSQYINANLNAGVDSSKAFWGKGAEKILGFSGGLNATGGVKSEDDSSHSQSDSMMASKAQEFLKSSTFSTNLENSMRGFQEGAFRTNSEDGNRLAESISSGLAKSQNISDSFNTNYQKAQSLREFASLTEENSASIDRNATHDYLVWMAEQSRQPGLGAMGAQQADYIIKHDPELNNYFTQKFVKETTEKTFKQWSTDHIKSNVKSEYLAMKNEVPGSNQVSSEFHASTNAVQEMATTQGVSQGLVDRSYIDSVNKLKQGTVAETFLGKAKIDSHADFNREKASSLMSSIKAKLESKDE